MERQVSLHECKLNFDWISVCRASELQKAMPFFLCCYFQFVSWITRLPTSIVINFSFTSKSYKGCIAAQHLVVQIMLQGPLRGQKKNINWAYFIASHSKHAMCSAISGMKQVRFHQNNWRWSHGIATHRVASQPSTVVASYSKNITEVGMRCHIRYSFPPPLCASTHSAWSFAVGSQNSFCLPSPIILSSVQ